MIAWAFTASIGQADEISQLISPTRYSSSGSWFTTRIPLSAADSSASPRYGLLFTYTAEEAENDRRRNRFPSTSKPSFTGFTVTGSDMTSASPVSFVTRSPSPATVTSDADLTIATRMVSSRTAALTLVHVGHDKKAIASVRRIIMR